MKKKTMRRNPREFGLSMFERAMIAKAEADEAAKREAAARQMIEQGRAAMEAAVRETFTAAQFHALIGDDSDQMVNKVGRIFYVVLGAAVVDELDPELPDIRILRGACNAMYEQAGEAKIAAARRAAMNAGLLACERLLAELDYDSVIDQAFELEVQLRANGHTQWSDFERKLKALTP